MTGNPGSTSSEFLAEVRPFFFQPVRCWRVAPRGASTFRFFTREPGPGGSDRGIQHPVRAGNTWLAKSFSETIGYEFGGALALGASSGIWADVSLVAAAYAWNDPAGGAHLRLRGFRLDGSTTPSTLFGALGEGPPSHLFITRIFDRRNQVLRPGFKLRHQRPASRCAPIAMTPEPDPWRRRSPGGTAVAGRRFSRFPVRGLRPTGIGLSSPQYRQKIPDTDLSVRTRADEDQFRMKLHAHSRLASPGGAGGSVTHASDPLSEHTNPAAFPY